MKIGQQPDISTAAMQSTQSATAKAAGQNAPSVAKNERKAPGVGVTVSNLARALESSGSNSADVDMEKVNAVRQAIEQKTFAVNPEAIADKLLVNAREMLNRSAN